MIISDDTRVMKYRYLLSFITLFFFVNKVTADQPESSISQKLLKDSCNYQFELSWLRYNEALRRDKFYRATLVPKLQKNIDLVMQKAISKFAAEDLTDDQKKLTKEVEKAEADYRENGRLMKMHPMDRKAGVNRDPADFSRLEIERDQLFGKLYNNYYPYIYEEFQKKVGIEGRFVIDGGLLFEGKRLKQQKINIVGYSPLKYRKRFEDSVFQAVGDGYGIETCAPMLCLRVRLYQTIGNYYDEGMLTWIRSENGVEPLSESDERVLKASLFTTPRVLSHNCPKELNYENNECVWGHDMLYVDKLIPIQKSYKPLSVEELTQKPLREYSDKSSFMEGFKKDWASERCKNFFSESKNVDEATVETDSVIKTVTSQKSTRMPVKKKTSRQDLIK